MVDFNSVLRPAKRLPQDQQLQLIDALWRSAPDDADLPLDETWNAELERRVASLKAGTAQLTPFEVALSA